MDEYRWVDDAEAVDYDELSNLYRIAPLGEKRPEALADGLDCSYLADVAVHPDHQGHGLGRAIIRRLVAASSDHKKIVLYANPGTEGFYEGLGFLHMNTAMGIWKDPAPAIASGVLRAPVPPSS